ncbi:DNA transfer protein [Citrobacter freundii]|uniref:DNA transfer protein n=1 Tax=Citrobacter freundii TaxID=546 RepID=UPI0028E0C6B3|nr:DNA transfer protein [Citrobacter freundii]MDT9381230.1 DNA transfer protein [Citrobacter freundii]
MSNFFALGRKLRGEEPLWPEKGGKGGSSSSGQKAAADATRYAADLQNEQFNRVMEQLAPYAAAGLPALQQIQQLSTLEGQGNALNQYYNSDQYKQLTGQARYQSLNAAEATGGLGSTATSNQLASIAPTLGQNWLSGQMQNYGNLLNIGQSAAAGQASAGQNYANNAGNLAQQMAAIRSQGSGQSAFGSAISGGTSGALAGAALGSVVPVLGTGVGAAIGGGLGLLGSLF